MPTPFSLPVLLLVFAIFCPVTGSANNAADNHSTPDQQQADAPAETAAKPLATPSGSEPASTEKQAEEQAEKTLQEQAGGSSEGADTNSTKSATPPETPTEALPSTLRPRELPPLKEMITSGFGPRRMPTWLSRRGMVVRDHTGIDLRAHQNWPVVAFRSGTVILAGNEGMWGIVVDIRQDDGMTARYAHMGKALVRKGQEVTQGTPVGLVGCTGRTTGAHLHFGLRDASGKLVDPLPFLSRGEDLLRPAPEDIPEQLTPQTCGPVTRGPDGRPARAGRSLKDLKALEDFTPPPIPLWKERR
ncbi:MAG: M23 family metallopeptidase [Desulfovibrio sp.]|uniref:M23 family metallopeptidase n=1 Tax=Desulfovibrio sp. TaxID=885 RepID=UPI002A36EEDD|nr:M23 family metallopeptidase [Desulfovibrio sp.]MDY0258787.1 M23 family metallopeptidase [Desulfovibrio sp.]